MGSGQAEGINQNHNSVERAEDTEELAAEDEGREQWDNQCEFFLSCLGYAVGFGNVWRFPHLCYKNGGAVFLIPYVIMLLCAGLPLFFMELSLGQYVSLGPNIVFPKVAPIASGIGWGMMVVSTLVAIYYNMILAWTFFYTFASFKGIFPTYSGILPWSHCDHEFSSAGCYSHSASMECAENNTVYYNKECYEPSELCNFLNVSSFNLTHCETVDEESGNITLRLMDDISKKISASEDYFKNGMLGVENTTWEDMGGMRWELVGCLALSWVVVCLCMIKGVKSSGKVVYFTALFPYVVLVILFIRGITLEGAMKGINFYIVNANVTKLTEVQVWNDAATQIFYSLGSSFGGLITLASYNKFRNNCMRDAITIALSNCATSVFAGFVIFSILGFMATELGKEIDDVVNSGSGLAFIAYPEAVTRMPAPPLWALLFFTMLITLGLDSQFTMVETLSTAIFDQFEFLRPKKPIVVVVMCVFLFLCGLTMCLDGGIYMFELFDFYSAGLSVIILAISEVIAIHYIYGFKNFLRNITQGMGIYMPKPIMGYWIVTWVGITPVILLIIFGVSINNWSPCKFGDYVFPDNIQSLGWTICASSIILIPVFAIYAIVQNRLNGEPWQNLFQTSEDFCPASERRLRTLKGAALKGQPDGVYRHTHDNEGFDEGVVRVYPRIGKDVPETYENQGYQGEARAYSRGGMNGGPSPFESNHM